ncbi:MAG: MarR family transcriptional regulator [Betaproteobacteria bacterium]|nr:MAG: MarR family transcriptional regulator [Betaproteobacteria bacterium]
MLGLTPPQFDVIATLGNTEGMSCKELGEKTLITKGTLTGVLDRLEQRRLIERREDAADARRTQIALTPAGESLFVQVFPAHLAHLERAFSRLSGAELKQLQTGLAALHHALDKSIAVMNAD